MAKIKCTECQNEVPEKALFCPKCGKKLEGLNPAIQIVSAVPEDGELLFSTRSLYDEEYRKSVIAVTAVTAATVSIGATLGLVICGWAWGPMSAWMLVYTLKMQNEIRESYVDLFENKIYGFSRSMPFSSAKAEQFAIDYRDVVRVEKQGSNPLKIVTAQKTYYVQAFDCDTRVKDMIMRKKAEQE